MDNHVPKSKLFIVGGGGHAISCVDVILSAGDFELIGFVDVARHAKMRSLGYKYLGNDSDIVKLLQSEYAVAIGIGQIHSATVRRNIYKMLQKYKANLPVIRASTSYVSAGASLGDATMVFHNAVVNIGVTTGSNCIINTSAVVEHGCSIGSHTHIAPRSIILGDVKVGEGCFIGSGSIIFQGITIPDYSVIPAGTVMRRSPNYESR